MGIISGKGLGIPKTVLASWVVCFAENLVGWTVGGLLGWFWLFALFPNRCSNLDKAELDSFLFLPNVLIPVLWWVVGGWVGGSELSGLVVRLGIWLGFMGDNGRGPTNLGKLTLVVVGGIMGLMFSLSSTLGLVIGGGCGGWCRPSSVLSILGPCVTVLYPIVGVGIALLLNFG